MTSIWIMGRKQTTTSRGKAGFEKNLILCKNLKIWRRPEMLYLMRTCRGTFWQRTPSGILQEQEAQRESPCHLLVKTGFGEPAKEAVAQMDAAMAQPTPEGEQLVTPAEAVAHVLPSKFLRNVGLEQEAPKRSATAAARVQDLGG